MSLAHDVPDVTVDELDEQQAAELFEAACQRHLGVSAEVFLSLPDSSAYPDEWSAQAIQKVEFLLPFVR